METTMSNIHTETAFPRDDAQQESAASRPSHRFGRPGDDVVRWGEFQLALWMGAFALTTMLGGFTFLHTAITDMRDELRTEMKTQDTGIRAEIDTLKREIDNLIDEVIGVRERVIRIETRLDTAAAPADGPVG